VSILCFFVLPVSLIEEDDYGEGKVTTRPGFSRTVLYFWVLSWISRCPRFVLDLKSSE